MLAVGYVVERREEKGDITGRKERSDGDMPDPKPQAQKSPPGGLPGFLAWFPWEKTLIWGLFLLLVYVLRHFFFIIFMTFLLSYIVSSSVKRVTGWVSPDRERAWLQRLVAVAGFAILLAVLYGVGTFLYRPLKTQAEGLYNRVVAVNFDDLFNDLLRRTVGAWRYESKYRGAEGAKLLDEEFAAWRKDEPEHLAESFREDVEELERTFRDQVVKEEGEKKWAALKDRQNLLLRSWIYENVAERKYQEGRKELEEEWQKSHEDDWILEKFPNGPTLSREEIRKLPEYAFDRERQIKRDLVSKEKNLDDHVAAFKVDLGQKEHERLEKARQLDGRFQEFYERTKSSPDEKFEEFMALRSAMRQSSDAFEAAWNRLFGTPEEREKRLLAKFRLEREKALAQDAIGKEKELEFLQLANIKKFLAEQLPVFTKWIANLGVTLVELTIQFALSLLLSFFITFDLPRLRRGIQKLEQSRIRDFYHEIAPGLASFGRLIGRAFQAQGVIALCNTLLTFIGIKLLGIQNEIFLCSIVFICSFIPVVGVVISSVPIALMAIIQPGGSIWLALWAIGAILVIHFIETSILNPKILGDMLHLHPVLVLGILAVGEYFFHVWGLLLGVPVAVYIIRHVILAEDARFSLSAQAAVAKVTGVRAPAPPPQEPIGAGKG